MNIQEFVNALTGAAARERANYHLTLGQLVEILSGVDASTPVVFDVGGSPAEPHSYRGYYSDLALEAMSDVVSAGQLLEECTATLGKSFEGYKGGDFPMTENTPLWKANYGDCGLAVVGSELREAEVVLITKDVSQ